MAESAPKLIPLDAWARAKYGERVPSIHTLRRWAREARIFPVPKKHGRTYYVNEKARYIDHHDPDFAKVLNESTPPE